MSVPAIALITALSLATLGAPPPAALSHQKPAAKPAAQHPTDKSKAKPAEKPKTAEKPAAKPIHVGDPVDPALLLVDTKGTVHKLQDMKGKTVALAFWSTSTGSVDERLKKVAADFSAKDVVTMLVDSDHADLDAKTDKPFAKIEEHAQKSGLTMPIVVDRDGALLKRFDVKETPCALVVDAQGVLRYSGPVGDEPDAKDKNAPSLRKALDGLLAAKPVPPAPPAGK
jgi:peroxiredoxin